jgi:hypothetical protein
LIVRYPSSWALLVEAMQQARHDVNSAGRAVVLVQCQHRLGYETSEITGESFSGVGVT